MTRTLSFGLAVDGTVPWNLLSTRTRHLEGAVPELSTLWVLDERFERDAWVSLGLLAASTRRFRLGTAVTDAFVRHPALTGTAIASVADASGGRAVLGLGAGVSGFRAMGIERNAPATALREAISLVRHLWSSPDAFDFAGATVSFQAGRLSFGPVPPVPIMVAGRGPGILRLAGEVADEVLVATFTDGPLLEHSLARLEEGIRRRPSGMAPIVRGAWVYTSVDDDREIARAAVREGIAVALWGSRPILDDLGIELPAGLRALMDARPYARTPEVIAEAAGLIPDALIDVCSVAGTPDECVDRFRRLAARGFEHIALWPFASDANAVEAVIERLSTDVLPATIAGAKQDPGRT